MQGRTLVRKNNSRKEFGKKWMRKGKFNLTYLPSKGGGGSKIPVNIIIISFHPKSIGCDVSDDVIMNVITSDVKYSSYRVQKHTDKQTGIHKLQ